MRSSRLALSFAVAIMAFASSGANAAADDDAIHKSIKRGVAYLKACHAPNPVYGGGSYGTGGAPLAGLALLESGVPESDASLRNIITFVRENALSQTATYNVSLTILFLDRLGNPADRPTIQLLGVRLLAGQEVGGGWCYECGNALSSGDEARLKKLFQNEQRLVAKQPRGDLPNEKKDPMPVVPIGKNDDDKPVLHPEVARWGKLINKNAGGGEKPGMVAGEGDNSNTQFAMLGVWTARKHGVPCDGAIAAFERRFRVSQSVDGSWRYTPRGFTPPNGSIPAMTCTGLLALAIARGNMENALKNKPDGAVGKPKAMADLGDDPAIKAALKFLGASLSWAKGQPPEGLINPAKRGKRFRPDDLNSNFYFLWSLERVAVLYGLETIGNHDWYIWGSDVLVDTQLANGSWSGGGYHGARPDINTAFALLFLNRANIARDLSVALKGKIKDPGVAVLRGGGDIANILPKQVAPKIEPKANVEPPKIEPKVNVDPPKVEPKTTVAPPKIEPKTVAPDRTAIAKALVYAADDDRSKLLAKYRDEKGSAYTDALASAANQWSGANQREAREALANRLARMKAATLRDLLKDEDHEIRRAAALACGAKEDKACVAELIEALRDSEEMVVRAARRSLKSITSQDFGPRDEAAANEKVKAVLAWRNWWAAQKR